MAGLTATTKAPKTAEDLRSLLAHDNKVKVAGTSFAWTILVSRGNRGAGIDGMGEIDATNFTHALISAFYDSRWSTSWKIHGMPSLDP